MFKVVIGHSNDPDSEEAIAEVLAQCLTQLEQIIPQAGILYAAIDFEYDLILEKIEQQFPQLELIGGTTDGEMSSILGFQEDSLVLILFCSDEVEIRAGLGTDVTNEPVAAVEQAIATANFNLNGKISFCLALVDGLTGCGAAIVEALKQTLGIHTPLFGGMTGDRLQFQTTYQFYRQQVHSNALVVLLFSGNLMFSYGVAKGWTPIGKIKDVTKVEKNILYEIDGCPALDFYQYYLKDNFPSLEYPLAVFKEETDSFYMRVPNYYDSETGSVIFFSEIPTGAKVQILMTDREQIIASSQESMIQALNQYPGNSPTVAFLFSCATRRNILGTKANQEYQSISHSLPANFITFGFYTYGEISPLENDPETFLHNETFITLLLGTR